MKREEGKVKGQGAKEECGGEGKVKNKEEARRGERSTRRDGKWKREK